MGLGSALSSSPATGSALAISGNTSRWPSDAAPLLWWERSGGASQWLVQSGMGAGLVRAVGQCATGGALNRQYHLDALGSAAATSTGTGATETTLTYDAWGNRLYPTPGPFPSTPVGNVAFTAAATGFGEALSLNNAGYVALPPSVWTPTTAFSVSCRIQSTYSGSNPAVILGVSSPVAPQQFWIELVNGVVYLFGYNLSTWVVSTTAVDDGNWHTVLVTYSSGVWTLYVDGVQNATGSGTYVSEPSVHVAIGGLPIAGGYRYIGLIDEVAIFNTVISTTVQTVPWANTTAGLVALYHLDGNLEDSAQSATSDNRLSYVGGSGYWQEPELGLAYVRARWLNEGTGSWLSVDPVTSEPRYSYAHNMPTTRVDPSGQSDPDVFDILAQVPSVFSDAMRFVISHDKRMRGTYQQVKRQAAPAVGKVVKKAVTDLLNLLQSLGLYDPLSRFYGWLSRLNDSLRFAYVFPAQLADAPDWAAGFAQGLTQTLIDGFLPVEMLSQAYEFIRTLFTAGDRLWQVLWQYAKSLFGNFMTAFGSRNDNAFTRGQHAATLFLAVLQLVLTALGFVAALPGEAALTPGVIGNMLARMEDEERIGTLGTRASTFKPTQSVTGHSHLGHGVVDRAYNSAMERLHGPKQGILSKVKEALQAQRYHENVGGVDRYTEAADQAVVARYRTIIRKAELPAISRNTGIPQDVLRVAKQHLFRTKHKLASQPGVYRNKLFTPIASVAEEWEAAMAKDLHAASNAELLHNFRNLIAHEYGESILMQHGLPYRHDAAWLYDATDGSYVNRPSIGKFGAHDIAPWEGAQSSSQYFRFFEKFTGKSLEGIPQVASDLSNLPQVMEKIVERLGL